VSNNNQGASAQTVSREEYRRLDNRVTCILQQRWPANEINQWVVLLKGKQQAVAIDQSGTIRCAVTGRTLWITPDSPTDRANLGAAEQLNPRYKPALHQVVADHRQAGKHHKGPLCRRFNISL
jgi:hypothetical protein